MEAQLIFRSFAADRCSPTPVRNDAIRAWLQAPATADLSPTELVTGVAERLEAAGLPLLRVGVWLSTQHPEVWGSQIIWTRGPGAQTILRPHDAMASPAFQGTPGQAVYQGSGPVRCRLDVPRSELRFPVLAEVADLGAIDYMIVPIPGGPSLVHWIAFATDRAGGFHDDELAGLVGLGMALTFPFRLVAARDASASLLRVYLGPNAADRVLAGEFHRGSGETIEAAIWFCDLRGFTSLGDRVTPRELVAVLDRYFEAVAGAIEDRGGEILKFIGDATLAIFPIGDGGPVDPCRRALAAAEDALAAVAALGADLSMGVSLHVGPVFYGNIGGRRRLDFTVIGAAVNEVCRVESLCKVVGVPLLMTARFARDVGRSDLVPAGRHALKGVTAELEIFRLPAPRH